MTMSASLYLKTSSLKSAILPCVDAYIPVCTIRTFIPNFLCSDKFQLVKNDRHAINKIKIILFNGNKKQNGIVYNIITLIKFM
ncbi:hypothetical protein EC2021H102_47100 [Escherichia coli]